MQRRPTLLNRPLKPRKAQVYRPGAKPHCCRPDAKELAPPTGLKRTQRLADKLAETRCGR